MLANGFDESTVGLVQDGPNQKPISADDGSKNIEDSFTHGPFDSPVSKYTTGDNSTNETIAVDGLLTSALKPVVTFADLLLAKRSALRHVDTADSESVMDAGPTISGKIRLAKSRSILNMNHTSTEFEENYERELEEKIQAWQNLSNLALSLNRMIQPKSVYIGKKLGRGKFAAVYGGYLSQEKSEDNSIQSNSILSTGSTLSETAVLPNNSPLPTKMVALKIAQFVGNMELVLKSFNLSENSTDDNFNSSFVARLYSDVSRKLFSDESADKDKNAEESVVGELMAPTACSDEFYRELNALNALSQHSNIVRLEGIVLSPLCLILERLDANLGESLDNQEWQYQNDPRSRLCILDNVVSAIYHMHTSLFVNRDVKPHNVLLCITKQSQGSNAVAKLSDFGTATKIAEQGFLTEPCGTSGYTAPEVTFPGKYAYPVDVFSLGVLAWSLFSQKHTSNPIAGLDSKAAATKLMSGIRPDFGPEHPVLVQKIVTRCWETHVNNRVSINDLHFLLQDICSSAERFQLIYDRPFSENALKIVAPIVRRRSLDGGDATKKT